MKLRIAMLAVLWILPAMPAFAQGCSMCYTSAAGSGKKGQQAISQGVMVLLAPPVGFMTLGVGLAYRYGRRRDQDKDKNGED